jgi:hypothetical protein
MTYNYSRKAIALFELDNGQDARKELDYIWDSNVSMVNLCQRGYGDSGDYCSVYIKEGNSTLDEKTLDDKTQALQAWMWEVAEELFPGYELDDGGRVELTFTKEDKTIHLQAEGWGYFMSETKEFEFQESP